MKYDPFENIDTMFSLSLIGACIAPFLPIFYGQLISAIFGSFWIVAVYKPIRFYYKVWKNGKRQ